MFLPISDAPNPKGVPYATWTLIALNVAVYLVVNLPLGVQPADPNDPAFREYLEFLSQYVSSRAELDQAARAVSAYDLVVFEHGYRPAEPSLVDLVTSMFMHGGLMHLFGNMLFLWIYGDNVERRLGVPWFVVAYLLTGVAATMFHAVFFASSNVPLVGASGAISGVLGFYFVWFPRNVVRVLFFLPPFFVHTFFVGARIVLGVYLFIDNVVPFLFAGEGGVAHGAHIGGFLAGAAAAALLNARATAAKPDDIGKPKTAPSGGRTVREALMRGDYAEAAAEYFALPPAAARGALAVNEAVALARWLREQGHAGAALTLLERVLREAPRGPDLAEGLALAGLILLEDRHDPTAAYQYLAAALQLRPGAATTAEIRRALAVIESLQKRPLRPEFRR